MFAQTFILPGVVSFLSEEQLHNGSEMPGTVSARAGRRSVGKWCRTSILFASVPEKENEETKLKEKNMWNEITTEKELNSFLDVMCYFHDSCLKEIKYISGAYVNEKLSMSAVNNQRTLSMIVQRQFKNPSVVEMQFAGLKYLKLFPSDENYTCEILDATMILKEDYIYWCDCGGLSEKDIESYTGTTICASKVRWRAVDEYIGAKEIYVTR